jgi:hypothetical protein
MLMQRKQAVVHFPNCVINKKKPQNLAVLGQHVGRRTEGRTNSPRRRRGLRGVGVIDL